MLSVSFALLGFAHMKAACKMLMKLTIGLNLPKIISGLPYKQIIKL
jgi:hypothetical protein